MRFALVGGFVAVVYISVDHPVARRGRQSPSRSLWCSASLSASPIHFTLQRVFVWRHHERFALAAHHQALRYLCMCFVQYGLTALSTSWLPGALGLPVEPVYLVSALGLAGLNFVVFRGRVFHADQPDG